VIDALLSSRRPHGLLLPVTISFFGYASPLYVCRGIHDKHFRERSRGDEALSDSPGVMRSWTRAMEAGVFARYWV